jgi:hypothetical protein
MARNTKFDDYEDDDEGTDWGSIAIGTMIGVGIGGLLGLLLAPKSGVETRADLNNQMDDLRRECWERRLRRQARRTDGAVRAIGAVIMFPKPPIHRPSLRVGTRFPLASPLRGREKGEFVTKLANFIPFLPPTKWAC